MSTKNRVGKRSGCEWITVSNNEKTKPVLIHVRGTERLPICIHVMISNIKKANYLKKEKKLIIFCVLSIENI